MMSDSRVARTLRQYGLQAALSAGGLSLIVTGFAQHAKSTQQAGAAVSIVAALALALVEIVRIRTKNAGSTAAAAVVRAQAREAEAWGKLARRLFRKLKPDSAQLEKLVTDAMRGAVFLSGHPLPPTAADDPDQRQEPGPLANGGHSSHKREDPSARCDSGALCGLVHQYS
jgi:hypothetical protein